MKCENSRLVTFFSNCNELYTNFDSQREPLEKLVKLKNIQNKGKIKFNFVNI